MVKVLIAIKTRQLSKTVDVLSKYAEVIVASKEDEKTLCREIAEVEILIVGTTPITKNIIDAAKKLKGIVKYGVGYDNIDVEAATEKNIVVINNPDYGIETVADHTFTLLLCLAKRVIPAFDMLRRREWPRIWFSPPSKILGIELEGKILGIVGFGQIGRRVAKRALACGMKIISYSPHVKKTEVRKFGAEPVNLEELIKKSDFISLHTSLTKETYHLFNEKRLKMMKREAFLINVARGPLIDEDALYKALKERWIQGAALDVFEIEPPSKENPLLCLDNVVLTPHIAWFSKEAIERLAALVHERTIELLKGRIPKTIINPSVLETRKV